MSSRFLLAAALLGAAPAVAEDAFPRIDAHAELINAVLLRNDADFDRSAPLYNENGQSAGYVGTVFRPALDFHVWRSLRLHYDAEVGINYWSKMDPDVQSALAPSVFVLKHRQLYGEGELLEGRVGFRVGYSRLVGPTGLFVNHWIGNGQLSYAPNDQAHLSLFAGQIPDSTYEGIEVEQNNFAHDITLVGVRGAFNLSDRARLDAGIEAVADTSIVRHARTVATPSLRLDGQLGPMKGFFSAALQFGRLEGEAANGSDETLLAWALQAHGAMPVGNFELTVNLLGLSPDDAADGNGRAGAFLYSGRNTSSTVLLTEDEALDWRDSLDRRMAQRRGGFWQNRAGLAMLDAKLAWAGERYRPGVIVGVATALNPGNALGNVLVGVEADAVLEARITEHLSGLLLVGTLVPGGAGAALTNRIDLHRVDPVFFGEASVRITY